MVRVITLDESGQFMRKSGVSLIGGCVADVESLEVEEKVIEELLKDICAEFNEKYLNRQNRTYKVIYPRSLHCGDINNMFFVEENISNTLIPQKKWVPIGKYNKDNRCLRNDKEDFLAFLYMKVFEYFKDKGYRIYIFVDPFLEEGYTEIPKGKSNLTDLEQGANLYERMAILSVYNNVFYSLENDVDEYVLELATRTLNDTDGAWNEMYNVYTNNSGEKKSTITNTSTYKTALATMLYEVNNTEIYRDIKYKLDVKSINYNVEKNATTPFQYLADIVCSYALSQIKDKFSIESYTKENKITSDGLEELVEECNIQIRVYDECDAWFRKMVDSIKTVNVVKFYEECYELERSTAKYKEFYIHYWMPQLLTYFQNYLSKNKDYLKVFEGKVPEFIVEINGYMGIRENAYEKGLYIAQKMLPIIETLNSYKERNKALFELCDIILRGYNHRGAVGKTREYVEKCEIYKGSVGIETYIEHTLRTLEFYFNSLDFEKALESGLRLEKLVSQLKKAYVLCYETSNCITSEIVDSVSNADNFQFKLVGKLWSNVGQAYSFLKKYSSGQRYFLKALNEFDPNSDDYKITMSHLLHLLISSGKRAQYETYAVDYFATKGLWDQMISAFASRNAFTIFVYIKAFNVFYAKDKSNKNILDEIVRRVRNMDVGREHPWELIYKNLYECILKQKTFFDYKDYQDIKEKALMCTPKADVTINMIQINTKLTFMKEEGADIENAFVIDCLDDMERNVCNLFWENVDNMTFVELKDLLDEKIVYAYR